MIYPKGAQRKEQRKMKKLMVLAAIAAAASGLFAAEGEAAKAKEGAAAAAPVAAEASVRGARPAGVPFDRAKFEERIKKLQEERRGKVADILKAAGVPDDKVGALVDEIDKVYARRRPSPRMQRPGGPNGAPRRQPRQRPLPAESAQPAAPAQK